MSITTSDRTDTSQLDQLVAAHPAVLRTTGARGDLDVTVDGPAGAIDLISQIADAQIGVDDMQIQTPTLDDVFFALTGGQPT